MQFEFWHALDTLVAAHTFMVDRPAQSTHPRFADITYPLDYGFLDGTTAGDGDGIDVWRGSLSAETVSAVVCTVDLFKRDSEVKLLVGCDSAECDLICAFHNVHQQSAILIRRPDSSTRLIQTQSKDTQ
jgi:inorganic pyrophosphatase